MGDGIIGTDINQRRIVVPGLSGIHIGIGADNQQITDTGLVGSGTIDTDSAGTARGGNGVGGEAFAVGDIVQMDLFKGEYTSPVKQILSMAQEPS